MNHRKTMFDLTTTGRILADQLCNDFIENLMHHLPETNRLVLSCYRAGSPVVEVTFLNNVSAPVFLLTIQEGELHTPLISADDIRLNHKEISLPDIVDILIFITRLSRYAELSPSLPIDTNSSSLFEFINA